MTLPKHLPPMLTAQEVADHLRTSRKAVYDMVQRAQLPSVTRVGRRLLFRTDVFLKWVERNTTTYTKEPNHVSES